MMTHGVIARSAFQRRGNLLSFKKIASPKKQARNDTSCGFTLIELVMTIVVTSIIAIPLSVSLSQHIQSVFQSQDYTMAVELGRYEMERVNKITNWNNIVSAPPYSLYNYDIIRTVTLIANTPPERLKKIQVDVRETGSATAIITFITYIAQNVNYGL